jgi:catechol 2,3-dioxygenase-like lactoylglutathione lyase family enzyme
LTHAAEIKAFYFQSAGRHPLELISFPPDKIKDKWKGEVNTLLKGIDHTAIVVNNSEVSVKFYTEFLGFELQNQNENYGTEQERLTQVFGARLRISALSFGEGIDLELLEYIAPPGGRSYPVNTQLNDAWAVQTVMKTEKSLSEFLNAEQFGGKITSEVRNRILIQDPDGHIIHIYN